MANEGDNITITGSYFTADPLISSPSGTSITFSIQNDTFSTPLSVVTGYGDQVHDVVVDRGGSFTGWWIIPTDTLKTGKYSLVGKDGRGYTASTQIEIYTQGNDWLVWHHDLKNTGFSPASKSPSNAHLAWFWNGTKGENDYYIIDEGAVAWRENIYFSAWRKLFCLNAITGIEVWNYTASYGFDFSQTPSIYEGKLYAIEQGGSNNFKLVCINASNGRLLMEHDEINRYVDEDFSPIIAYGKIFVSASGDSFENTGIYCFDLETLQLLWIEPLSSDTQIWNFIWSTAAVQDSRLYYYTDYHSESFNIFSRTRSFLQNSFMYYDYAQFTSPIISGTNVYVVGNNNVTCLSARSGIRKWSSFVGDVRATPAVAYGHIYVASVEFSESAQHCMVKCLDALTGDVIWSTNLQDTAVAFMCSAPSVADDKVFLFSDDSILCCLNATTGKVLWSFRAPNGYADTTPVIANDMVYVTDGVNFYAFSIEDASGDFDGDSVTDEIDVRPLESWWREFTDASINGTTIGYLTDAGDQRILITDLTYPDGIQVKTDVSGGLKNATVGLEGISFSMLFYFDANEEAILTDANSYFIKATKGTIKAQYLESTNTVTLFIPEGAYIKLDYNNGEINIIETNNENVEIITDTGHYYFSGGQSLAFRT
jgi:outer membrane protein assembly factor BamB